MSEPCPRCGGTKTDPVPKTRTMVRFWARLLGYELRQCGRCRHLRWMDPQEFHKPPEDHGAPAPGPAVQAVVQPAVRPAVQPAAEPVGASAPADGPAAHTVFASAPVDDAAARPVGASASAAEAHEQPAVATVAAAVDEPSRAAETPLASAGARRRASCPQCGSPNSRRSRRRLLDRLLLRGPLARCRECDCRFSLARERQRVHGGAHA